MRKDHGIKLVEKHEAQDVAHVKAIRCLDPPKRLHCRVEANEDVAKRKESIDVESDDDVRPGEGEEYGDLRSNGKIAGVRVVSLGPEVRDSYDVPTL